MSDKSAIEWTDATFNPWVGCAKVSPGCAHCYAEMLVTGRMARPGTWGEDGTRQRTSESNWRKPLAWERHAQAGRLPDGKTTADHRPRVFCASLADVFEPRPELEPWRQDLFGLIEATPSLDWQLLTKRPDEARDFLNVYYDRPAAEGHYTDPPLPNVWIGTSIENARFTWRADVLREIQAAVRFISAEPLLGSLINPRANLAIGDARFMGPRRTLDLSGIDWLIVGGESGGRDARPMHPEWARELRDACLALATKRREKEGPVYSPETRPAFFFKQWGCHDEHGVYRGASPKAGGRLLDGREWNEMPETRQKVAA